MAPRLGTSDHDATDPRGGFRHKPGFTMIRGLDGFSVRDDDDSDPTIDRNEYDPYSPDPAG